MCNIHQRIFIGSIPAELGNLALLRKLMVNHNRLGGKIPGELASPTMLEVLSLNDNRLSGVIPEDLGKRTIKSKEKCVP